MQFPPNAAPVADTMQIYSGTTLDSSVVPPMPLCSYYGNCYVDKVAVTRQFSAQDTLGQSEGIIIKAVTQCICLL